MSVINAYKKINIFTKILAGFIVGIGLGVVLGPQAAPLEFLGTILIRLISMVVVPLVLCMMVVAVADVGAKSLGRVGVMSTLMFILSTPIAIGVGLAFAHLFNVGAGFPLPYELSEPAAATTPSMIQTLVNIIPNNIFAALTSANLLQVMFFAIMTGIAISALKDKEKAAALIDLFRSFGDVMQKILGFVMGFTPFGVMGIIAWMVGAHGLSILVPFASFVAAVYAASIFYVIVVQVILMARVVGKVSPIVFLRGAKEAMLFVFATSSSFATLPLALAASMKMGVSNRITNFVIPYGTVINMDGTAIYLAIAVVFVARIYGIALGLNEMILIVLTATLASIGTAGVPGAGVVMLNIVLISLNLPLGAVALLLGFDRMISPTRATPNVVGDLAVAVMVARLNGEMKDNPALEEGVSPIAVGEVEAAR